MLHTDIDKRYKDVLSIINDLSKIDEKMDWRYDIIEEEREFVWSLDNPSSIVTVRVEENEGKYLTSVKNMLRIVETLKISLDIIREMIPC